MALGGTGAAVAATQPLAIVNHDTRALSKATGGSKPVARVKATRPITGGPTVLPVISRHTDARGGRWVRVLLPGRPNSRTGWIPARAVTPVATTWTITIRVSTRQVTAVRAGRPARTFRAVVGTPATPTPLGRFFVEEIVELDRLDVGAPYALALSARSEVLQEFAGGPGQVAIHGTSNIGGMLGGAASHGCVRLDTKAINWLAAHVGPGVPVTITR